MSTRTRRHLNLLSLSRPLHLYARSLQSDVNASYLLVHQAMTKAFARDSEPSAELAVSLRADVRKSFLRARR